MHQIASPSEIVGWALFGLMKCAIVLFTCYPAISVLQTQCPAFSLQATLQDLDNNVRQLLIINRLEKTFEAKHKSGHSNLKVVNFVSIAKVCLAAEFSACPVVFSCQPQHTGRPL